MGASPRARSSARQGYSRPTALPSHRRRVSADGLVRRPTACRAPPPPRNVHHAPAPRTGTRHPAGQLQPIRYRSLDELPGLPPSPPPPGRLSSTHSPRGHGCRSSRRGILEATCSRADSGRPNSPRRPPAARPTAVCSSSLPWRMFRASSASSSRPLLRCLLTRTNCGSHVLSAPGRDHSRSASMYGTAAGRGNDRPKRPRCQRHARQSHRRQRDAHEIDLLTGRQ